MSSDHIDEMVKYQLEQQFGLIARFKQSLSPDMRKSYDKHEEEMQRLAQCIHFMHVATGEGILFHDAAEFVESNITRICTEAVHWRKLIVRFDIWHPAALVYRIDTEDT